LPWRGNKKTAGFFLIDRSLKKRLDDVVSWSREMVGWLFSWLWLVFGAGFVAGSAGVRVLTRWFLGKVTDEYIDGGICFHFHMTCFDFHFLIASTDGFAPSP
jgi:hypothetical protein